MQRLFVMACQSRCKSLFDKPIPKKSFYRRELPTSSISLKSDEGKGRFLSALHAETAEPFYDLISCFQTQFQTASCGLTTLAMVLNALQIDPREIWKRPWRWFSEESLSCCVDMEHAKHNGTSMDQIACLAICNGATVSISRNVSSEKFRSKLAVHMRKAAEPFFIVLSYSRQTLGQAGHGHFTAIAAYDEKSDSCLVLDVARFKYPPHWVVVDDLVNAMNTFDRDTGKERGMLILGRAKEIPAIMTVNIQNVKLTALHDIVRFINDYGNSKNPKLPWTLDDFVLALLEHSQKGSGNDLLDIIECRLDGSSETESTDHPAEIKSLLQAVQETSLWQSLALNPDSEKQIARKFTRSHGLFCLTLFILAVVRFAEQTSTRAERGADSSCSVCHSHVNSAMCKKLLGFTWESTPLALKSELEAIISQLVSVSDFTTACAGKLECAC